MCILPYFEVKLIICTNQSLAYALTIFWKIRYSVLRTFRGYYRFMLRKNFIYNFLYQLLIMIIPLILMPYLSRSIGVDGVGAYSYTYAIAQYFVLFAMLGLNNYGSRTIAKEREEKYSLSKVFWNIYFLQLFTASIAILCYIFYIVFYSSNYKLFLIIQMIYVMSAMFDINWLYSGLEKFKLLVIRNILIKLFTVSSILIFVKNESDVWIYVLIMSVGTLMSNILMWSRLKRHLLWVKPSMREIYKHLKPNSILFISVISVSLYKIMDKVMLGTLSDVKQLGYYDFAEKINYIQISLATALGTVMLPKMSNLLYRNNLKEFNELIKYSMQFVMCLSFAFCFGLIGIADDFVPLFLGEEFLISASLLKVLAFSGLFVSWANVIRTNYLIPKSKDKIYVLSVLLGGASNLIINILLIPSMGAMGAVIGTLIAEGVVALYQTIKVRRELNIFEFLKDSFVFFTFGIMMLLGVKVIGITINNINVRLFTQVFLGGTIYCSLSIIYLYVFHKEKIRILLKK
jgi:O-antigen/teichoic acid export membrane protein